MGVVASLNAGSQRFLVNLLEASRLQGIIPHVDTQLHIDILTGLTEQIVTKTTEFRFAAGSHSANNEVGWPIMHSASLGIIN